MPKGDKSQYFRDKIKEFYNTEGRNFYWRSRKLTPFQMLLTEFFLKKTKAEMVDQFIPHFLKKYPDNKCLLKAKFAGIYKDISHLGLGSQRSRGLMTISRYINDNLSGNLPGTPDEIVRIPHVGMYTGNATLCFGFGKRLPILDVNSSRVISRFFGIRNNKDLRDNIRLQKKALGILPREGIKEYNWGLLDFGAMVCKPKPMCSGCPLRRKCIYYRKNKNTY
jgi:A/G-specific adenine glycosylase